MPRVAHEDWERQFRHELELCLFGGDADHQGSGDYVTVEAIELSGSYPDTEVAIVFRTKDRPRCLYGFRWGSIWDWLTEHGPETPISLAHLVWANWEESLLVLPEECDPQSTNWYPERAVADRRVAHNE